MNRSDVIKKWTGNVVYGTKHNGRYSGSAYWFRGNVLYKHEEVCARLEQTITGDWFALKTYQHWQYIEDPRKSDVPTANGWQARAFPELMMPSIGVATYLPGDVLRGDELHEHMFRQFAMRLDRQLEDARSAPITQFSVNQSPYSYKETNLREWTTRIYKDCQTYRENFKPDMPLLPNIWAELEGIITSRVDRYNAPLAVAKRERAVARKAARVALGL